nr:unnamed protein product [Spirometra erinaceieuropaei]
MGSGRIPERLLKISRRGYQPAMKSNTRYKQTLNNSLKLLQTKQKTLEVPTQNPSARRGAVKILAIIYKANRLAANLQRLQSTMPTPNVFQFAHADNTRIDLVGHTRTSCSNNPITKTAVPINVPIVTTAPLHGDYEDNPIVTNYLAPNAAPRRSQTTPSFRPQSLKSSGGYLPFHSRYPREHPRHSVNQYFPILATTTNGIDSVLLVLTVVAHSPRASTRSETLESLVLQPTYQCQQPSHTLAHPSPPSTLSRHIYLMHGSIRSYAYPQKRNLQQYRHISRTFHTRRIFHPKSCRLLTYQGGQH